MSRFGDAEVVSSVVIRIIVTIKGENVSGGKNTKTT